MAHAETKTQFALCIRNDDCDDLERRKVYQVFQDDEAAKEGYLRVVDESGEDYLYPAQYFVLVDLPHEAMDALTAARGVCGGRPRSEALLKCIELERKIVHARWVNEGYESSEEDSLLEEMDDVWWRLAAEEREMINKEPPRSLIRTGPHERANECVEVDVFSSAGSAARLGEVAGCT